MSRQIHLLIAKPAESTKASSRLLWTLETTTEHSLDEIRGATNRNGKKEKYFRHKFQFHTSKTKYARHTFPVERQTVLFSGHKQSKKITFCFFFLFHRSTELFSNST